MRPGLELAGFRGYLTAWESGGHDAEKPGSDRLARDPAGNKLAINRRYSVSPREGGERPTAPCPRGARSARPSGDRGGPGSAGGDFRHRARVYRPLGL